MKRYIITREQRYLNLDEIIELNDLFKNADIQIEFKCLSKDRFYAEIKEPSLECKEAIKKILTTLEYKIYTTSKTDYELYMQNRKKQVAQETQQWKQNCIAQ